MPAEKIHRTRQYAWSRTDADGKGVGGTVEQTQTVTVAWGQGDQVNIGVDGGQPFWYADDNLNHQGEDAEPYTALWMSLDRAEINRLIKALRRARDAAYGRDE